MKLNTKIIVYISLLAAISAVLMFFPHFPVLPGFSFLDVDFADVPAMLASVSVSPIAAVIIELIKNITHLPVSSTGFVGELSNFIVGSVFSVSLGLLSKFTFNNTVMKKKLIYILPVCVILQTIIAAFSNYFIIAPMYFGNDAAKIANFVVAGAIPFNLIKGSLQAIAFYFVFRGVYPYIKKNMYLFR